MERNLIQIQYMTIEVRKTVSTGEPEKSRYMKGFMVSHQEKDKYPEGQSLKLGGRGCWLSYMTEVEY